MNVFVSGPETCQASLRVPGQEQRGALPLQVDLLRSQDPVSANVDPPHVSGAPGSVALRHLH